MSILFPSGLKSKRRPKASEWKRSAPESVQPIKWEMGEMSAKQKESTAMKEYHHFCDCGRHFFCGSTIVLNTCEVCGAEYLGPECQVTQPLPVSMNESGHMLCRECRENVQFPPTAAVTVETGEMAGWRLGNENVPFPLFHAVTLH